MHLRANTGAMDRVYLDTWLVILNVAGENPDGGLPGVYSIRRRRRTCPARNTASWRSCARSSGALTTIYGSIPRRGRSGPGLTPRAGRLEMRATRAASVMGVCGHGTRCACAEKVLRY